MCRHPELLPLEEFPLPSGDAALAVAAARLAAASLAAHALVVVLE